MTVVIQREDNDPIALRISIGGTPEIGYYFTYRGEPEQILPMLEIVHKEATAALSPQPKPKPAVSTDAQEPSGDDTLTEILNQLVVDILLENDTATVQAEARTQLLQYIEGIIGEGEIRPDGRTVADHLYADDERRARADLRAEQRQRLHRDTVE